jgi:photosystem II stability/assembly factor-like uncharacterized protein
MAKKAAKKKPARKTKTPKSKAAAKRRAKGRSLTSKDKWKQAAAKRWPAIDRPLARAMETEGSLGAPTKGASAQPAAAVSAQPMADVSGEQMAASRLAALVEAAAVTAPGAAAAPPTAPAIGSSNWTPLGPMAIPFGQTYGGTRVLVSGRVTCIAIDPTAADTIYLGTAQGGVWKSTDNGTTWDPKTDNENSLAIGALALDPNSPQIVYAGTGEGNFSGDSYYGLGILKSIDGGASWTNLAAATFFGNRFCRLVVDGGSGNPATRLFAAAQSGLYRSQDGGVTWILLTSGLPAGASATDIVLDAPTNTLYVAFWGKGIYKSTNANAVTPNFSQLTSGLPVANAAIPNGVTRIALGMSPSNPSTVFALMANNDTTNYTQHAGAPYNYAIDKFYVTTNGGTSWTAITLPGPVTDGIGGQGFYNLAVTVDPSTPDIVYLSGISLWKAVKSGGNWTITDIGGAFHPDNHAVTFRPGDHLKLWAGSDGGIYRSTDGGVTWDDSVNKGLCVMQIEFIDQHPSSPAVVFAGTQDNGTEQYRGTPVFNHADDGDGGFVVVNQSDPTHVVSTYYYPSPKLSTQGGKFGTWTGVSTGIGGTNSLFYPPMTACRTNASALALGTTLVNITLTEGTGLGWTTQVTLPGLAANTGELVSALSYVNANLIYAGTNQGKVYKLTFVSALWGAIAINAPPLPAGQTRYITDIGPLPANSATIIVTMGGFGTGHVWQGVVPTSGVAAWTNKSGALPDIPVNALVIDPSVATGNRMFIGTDIGVFETTNGGTNWSIISASSTGLPNCAVFDLRLNESTRILRAATHGRGLWEKLIDATSTPAVDIYVRDHVMDTAREFPPQYGIAAAFEDPLRYVALGDPQFFWMCADIKVDALEGTIPSYQFPVTDVDYVTFESKLQHRQPQRTKVNRVYVQIHNRGFQAAVNVNVKILWAEASAGLPNLPSDFWTAFPGDSSITTQWHPVGAAQTIASFKPGIPTILEWDWTPPATAADHSCMLVVMDCASDPIPSANKVFDVGILIPTEKHVGLKNLHLIDSPPAPPPGGVFGILNFHPKGGKEQTIQLVPHGKKPPKMSLIFSKKAIPAKPKLSGLTAMVPSKTMCNALAKKYGDKEIANFDTTRAFTLESSGRAGSLEATSGDKAIRAIVAIEGAVAGGGGVVFSVVQMVAMPGLPPRVVGGSTFAMKKR